MNPEKLMDCIGEIHDSIIIEADTGLADSNPVSISRKERNMMKLPFKWLIPATVCLAAVAAIFTAPKLLNSPGVTEPPGRIIIVGETPDGFVMETNALMPVYLSPMLREAMASANPGDLLKTIVWVPGFWEYRDAFEVDGVTYWDFYMYVSTGEWWKDDAGRREDSAEMWAKLEAMEDAAYASFREKAIAGLNGKIGAFEITDDEYFSRGYTFIANLLSEQIRLLEEDKIFMKLWSPNWNTTIPALEPEVIP
jgi:hypothetical protein